MRFVRWQLLAACAVASLLSVSSLRAGDHIPYPTEPKTWHDNLFGDIWKRDNGAGHIRAWGEALYISPRGVDLAFAVPVDSCDTLIPVGPVAIVTNDYEITWRAGIEFALSCDTSVGGSYTQLNNHNQIQVSAPAGRFLHALTTIAGESCDDSNIQEAAARYDIDLQIADLEGRYRLCGCNSILVNLVVGGRYAHLEEEFAALYSILGQTGVVTDVIFDGGGPRVGVESEFCVAHGLGVYAKGSASFLVGKFNTHYAQANIFEGLQAEVTWEDRRIITILELEAGVSWTSCNECIRVSAGYFVSTWQNVETVPGVIANLQEGKFNGRSESIEFDGIVGRVEVRY
jgi:hypothetical protein